MARKKKREVVAWYGVKSVFRVAAVGKPCAKDADYDPLMTLVEERVVVVRARGFAGAFVAAERDARAYARGSAHVNPYGQRVVRRRLRGMDAFELFNPPGSGREVFSTTEAVSKGVSDRTVVARRLGRVETPKVHRSRRNVLNREFSGSARRGV